MTTQHLLLLASGVYLAALVVTVYFSRATPRRVLGAVVGGVAVAIVGFGVEVLCQALGFWRYPSDDSGRGPLLIYPLTALTFAILSLIGWRVIRRFGWRGEVVFLVVVAVQGSLRDYFEAGQAMGIIAFATGLTTVLVDAVCWFGLTALAQGVMRLVAGPAAADQLAHRPWQAVEPSTAADRDCHFSSYAAENDGQHAPLRRAMTDRTRTDAKSTGRGRG